MQFPVADAPLCSPHAPAAEPSGAETVYWDLTDLYPDVAALEADLVLAKQAAGHFAQQYRGTIGALEADDLAAAFATLGGIQDRLGRAYTYAYLHWSTGTDAPARGALLQTVREGYTAAMQQLLFVDVEWAQVPNVVAEGLLAHAVLAPYRHYLELQQRQKQHILSEPEEKLLAEKDVTGRAAWNRFFDETLGAARFTFRGDTVPEQTVLTKLHDADRSVRHDAALSLTEGLVALQRPLTFVFNTVLADKASTDRLRGYAHWLDSRNLSNEADAASVQALIEAVTGRYDLVQRFYRLKRHLLGLEVLMDYDRYAPVGEAERRFSWDDARAAVTTAYGDFLPEFGDIVDRFFEGRWIDAAVVPGKRGGAYSHGAVPSAHPYILMNYTGRVRDVQTLAHELGHGLHQYLSRAQSIFHADTPLTTAETASVFGEMLTFQRLLAAETDPRNRLAMLVGKIDDTMATVFRQVTMNRFEDAIHTHRRTHGELSADDFGGHWMTTQQRMFGDSVTLGEHYRHWWSYIPHFIHTPGYVYAYAFGELLVLALYARYRDEGAAFAGKYRTLLEAGGSDWPHVLVGKLGIDLQDPQFWHQGLAAIERLIAEAEALAQTTEPAR